MRDKNKKAKDILEKVPYKTLTLTTYALRWVLLLVLVYIVISTMVLFFTGGADFLRQIVTWSIGGFFGFFMGYFGWMFAQHMLDWLSARTPD